VKTTSYIFILFLLLTIMIDQSQLVNSLTDCWTVHGPQLYSLYFRNFIAYKRTDSNIVNLSHFTHISVRLCLYSMTIHNISYFVQRVKTSEQVLSRCKGCNLIIIMLFFDRCV